VTAGRGPALSTLSILEVEGGWMRRLLAAHLMGPAGTCTDVPTGPLTELSHCRFLGGHRHTRAIAKYCEAGAPPWGDGRRLSGGSHHCLRRLLYHRHAATCGVPAAVLLSLRRSIHWPALVEIKYGQRAATTPVRDINTTRMHARAKRPPPGPGASARGARPTLRLPSPISTAAADAFALSTYT